MPVEVGPHDAVQRLPQFGQATQLLAVPPIEFGKCGLETLLKLVDTQRSGLNDDRGRRRCPGDIRRRRVSIRRRRSAAAGP